MDEFPIKKNLIIIRPQSGGMTATEIISEISHTSRKILCDYTDSKEGDKLFEFKEDISCANGASTALYKIKPTSSETRINLLHRDKLLIRIYDDGCSHKDLALFIETKYKKHKEDYPINIIDVFYYGRIYIKEHEWCYLITRTYNTTNALVTPSKLTSPTLLLIQSMRLLKALLVFLNDLYVKNICYRDLKTTNIGYNDSFNLVVIDYDIFTLLSIDDVFKLHTQRQAHKPYIYGTYTPKYIVRDIDVATSLFAQEITKKIESVDVTYEHDFVPISIAEFQGLNKMYSIGLAETIASLFFNDYITVDQMNQPLFQTPNKYFVSDYDATHVHTKYPDIKKFLDIIRTDLKNMQPKSIYRSEVNLIKLLKHIIANLTVTPYYTDIYTPEQILNLITKYETTHDISFLSFDCVNNIMIDGKNYEKMDKFATKNENQYYDFYDMTDGTSRLMRIEEVNNDNLYCAYDDPLTPGLGDFGVR